LSMRPRPGAAAEAEAGAVEAECAVAVEDRAAVAVDSAAVRRGEDFPEADGLHDPAAVEASEVAVVEDWPIAGRRSVLLEVGVDVSAVAPDSVEALAARPVSLAALAVDLVLAEASVVGPDLAEV